MSIYLGIDSGTQGAKCVALDLDEGAIVGEAKAPHKLIQGLPPGHMEQDPQDWVRSMEVVISQVVGRINRRRVRGIGISGQQHGFVPLDGAGRVIRPAKLWCDTSTAPECALLTRRMGGARAAIRATGLSFLPGYTAPKILWLKRHEPGNFRRLRHVLLPHDYLNFYLTGNYTMEAGDASGTALLDVRRRVWSRQAIEAIDKNLGDCLPSLIQPNAAAGVVKPALARKWGLPADVVVSAGGGDNMMGAIGTGNVVPGIVTASFGTSGTIYAYSSRPVVDPAGEVAAFCSSTGGWLPLICTMNVTGVTEEARGLLGLDHDAFDAAVSAEPPGAGGLVLLPYLDGERTPNLPGASGVLFGLRRGSLSPGSLARAAMEGATFGMNYGLLRLRRLGIRPREIRVTGGGAKSPGWRKIMAGIFGVPVVAMAEMEGAALGAAIQASWCAAGAGRTPPGIADLVAPAALDESTRCVPDPKIVRRYEGVQETHDRLRIALAREFGWGMC